MYVLLEDKQKNWVLGKRRPYGVDKWLKEKITPEQYLQLYIKNKLIPFNLSIM